MRRLVLVAVVFGLLSTAASVAAHPPGSVIPLPTDFGPEGIAAGRGATFFVGSLVDGDIITGDVLTGSTTRLVDAPAGRMAVGLSYDRRHDLLFVAGGFTGQAYVYDASTGEPVALFQLAGAPAFINDIVATRTAAWFTDSVNPQLYRVPIHPDGSLGAPETLPLQGAGAATPGQFNVNGIEATADGKTLIIAHSALASLFLVDPDGGQTTQIDLGGAGLPAVDGIVLDGRTLWAVQNVLNQVVRIRLEGDLRAGMVVDTLTDDGFRVPTTAARFGNRLALPNARFDVGFPSPGRGLAYEVVVVPAR